MQIVFSGFCGDLVKIFDRYPKPIFNFMDALLKAHNKLGFLYPPYGFSEIKE